MQPSDNSKEHNCIPDEHYVQTLLAQKGLEREVTRRTLTHTAWDLSSSREHERRGWHPITYKLTDATPALIQSIKVRYIFHCLYAYFSVPIHFMVKLVEHKLSAQSLNG
ncbi:uncharacterized protein LOC111409315 [Olea europaea var. sylvestris]|uniref:uncharacterized protein LOC111409315 n=1 Tax=Olea europaea var. sylvestris TaxID=158386 RepID=UPI000C1D4E93|nr:uncharacterized protein LOC111409315 [Olea europaea var. sylvestris]